MLHNNKHNKNISMRHSKQYKENKNTGLKHQKMKWDIFTCSGKEKTKSQNIFKKHK
jgi:hypothetical protein